MVSFDYFDVNILKAIQLFIEIIIQVPSKDRLLPLYLG